MLNSELFIEKIKKEMQEILLESEKYKKKIVLYRRMIIWQLQKK